MAYKALYRTYRPSTFDEVAGQQHVVKTLKNALATGKIAHAYLFAGPRGTGKTTMAKLLAKALNCDEGIGHQCNNCKNCLAIIEGTHPDVLEIDAASNNGVDEIRDLIDKVKYGTILGKYKIYIIDEVHMMTPGAFNALLKTLEEPPEHVIFILATTEPHKILPTILSRCQRYDFTKVNENDIRERLKIILQTEKIEYNEEAVNLIISLADGGMRDALSILDQVLAYTGDHLNVDDVLDMFALESTEEKISLLTSISNHDIGDVLSRLNQYISRGSDIRRLTNDLLLIMKDILIYQQSGNTKYLEILNDTNVNLLADKFSSKEALAMIDTLMGAMKDYKNVTSINPLFEVTLLKLTTMSANEEAPVKEVKAEPKPAEKPATTYEKPAIPAPSYEKIEKIDGEPLVIKGIENNGLYVVNDDLMLSIMVTSKKDTKNEIIDKWGSIKRYLNHPELGKAASLLVDAHPLVASKKVLIVESQFPKNVEKINAIDNQKELQNIIYNILGRKIFIYAVSRNESIRLQKEYMDRFQVGKLPKQSEINIEFIGE